MIRIPRTKNNKLNRQIRRARKTRAQKGGRHQLRIRKTNMHLYAEIMDAQTGNTMLSLSTAHASIASQVKKGAARVEAAITLGSAVAKLAQDKGVKSVSFDRSGYLYHGVVKAFADAVRAGNIEF